MSEHPLFCARLCLEGIDDKCNEKRRTSERETQREQRGYNIAVLPTKPYVWMHWGLFVHHFTSASFSHYKGGIKKNWHFLYFFHCCPPLFLAMYPQCFITFFTRSLSKCLWPAASQQLPICQGSVQMVMCWPQCRAHPEWGVGGDGCSWSPVCNPTLIPTPLSPDLGLIM